MSSPDKKEFEEKLKILLNQNPELAKEAVKLYMRVKKHGDSNIKMKCGRVKVSDSHKKETYRKYYEKKKAEKIALEGHKKIGRPKKTPLPDNEVKKEPKPRGRPRKNQIAESDNGVTKGKNQGSLKVSNESE